MLGAVSFANNLQPAGDVIERFIPTDLPPAGSDHLGRALERIV
jgi:hypothetical protein